MEINTRINQTVLAKIISYTKPETKYITHNGSKKSKKSVPNPDRADICFTYMILIALADNDTGISKISYAKLKEKLGWKDDHKVRACIEVMVSLNLIHYKSGSGFGEDTFSNRYIFPCEKWILPPPEEYDDYIKSPNSYSKGIRKEYIHNKKTKSTTKKKTSSVPEREKTQEELNAEYLKSLRFD